MATYFQSSFTCGGKKSCERWDIWKTLQTSLKGRIITHREICILRSKMLCDVGHPFQRWYHCRRKNRGGWALGWTMLLWRSVPVQAKRGGSLWKEGVTQTSRGRRREGGNPQPTIDLHPKPPWMICVWATVKIAVVCFISGIHGVELLAAVTTDFFLVTMEIDVRLLSHPGGGAVGGAWSPDREEFIGQVVPPKTTERVWRQTINTVKRLACEHSGSFSC